MMAEPRGAPLAGVMGWPIGHSLSPRLHGYWLRQYGIEGDYVPLAVAPADFETTFRGLHDRGFVGVNVTIPHKEAALAAVDDADATARRIGAANTITISADGGLYAENTDAFGFLANLEDTVDGWDAARGPAVVIGAGGAARAICVALADAGSPEVRIVNRTAARAEAMAADLDGPFVVRPWADAAAALADAALMVNTTAMGMAGNPPLDIALDPLPTGAVVNDIVYRPLETPLLAAAKARGNPTVDGLGMLLHQGRPGFARWFGTQPEVTDALRAHVLAGMAGD